jgi:hypothetical protein
MLDEPVRAEGVGGHAGHPSAFRRRIASTSRRFSASDHGGLRVAARSRCTRSRCVGSNTRSRTRRIDGRAGRGLERRSGAQLLVPVLRRPGRTFGRYARGAQPLG